MYHIIIQRAAPQAFVPETASLRQWTKKALSQHVETAEITVRIVDRDEMSSLNATYRHKKGPTNVLSFPFSMPEDVLLDVPILGDIVICAEVVNDEASKQNKQPEAHWAHMVIHGTLHLLGYDHETNSDAEIMEKEEVEIMQALKFPDPYKTGDEIKKYD